MNEEPFSRRLLPTGSESHPYPTDPGAHARLGALHGEPLLLEGEDPAAYEQLLARVWAAVNPADVLDEMFTVDLVSLAWEVTRWRRLKLSMIRKRAIEKLERFLREELPYNLYFADFVDDLTEILEEKLPDDQANRAQTLAEQCARTGENADKINNILSGAGLRMDQVVHGARDRRVKELVKEYAQREPDAVTVIDELLSSAGKSINILMAEALDRSLEYVDRIDRLTAGAESRRNASLREIDRRRPLLAETLRRTVQQIEHDELKVIETTPTKVENTV